MDKTLIYKSPLRYPGGKTRAINILKNYIPDNIKTICSPFIGGGSFELYLTSLNIQIKAYDNLDPLVHFWQNLIDNNKVLAESINAFMPTVTKEQYKILKQNLSQNNLSSIEKASTFYVINRCSFGGVISGGMSPNHTRFNQKSIDNIKQFHNDRISIQYSDFKDSISNDESDMMFLDPPYYINNNIYGDGKNKSIDFDHDTLYTLLKNKPKWILCYNDCEYIRKLYRNYTIETLEWKYGINKTKLSNEIVIINN